MPPKLSQREPLTAPPKPGNGIAFVSLVLGLLSFLGGVTALPGIICGLFGLNKSKDTGIGQRYAVAGIISSIAGIPVGLWIGSALLNRYFPDPKPDDDTEFRVQSTGNLNKIGIGLRNYDGQYGALPLGAMCDEDGKPLLSWRVAILPYVDQRDLYDKFNLDEPWDSPQNKPLIAQMPAFYANPKKLNDQSRGETLYKVFVGKDAVFSHALQMDGNPNDPENLNRWSVNSLFDSKRGLANVVWVVEAGDPVIWTKPDDLKYDENGPLPNLKPLYPNVFFALMGDGRVVGAHPKNPNFEAALRASIDPDGTSPFMIDQ
jgi:hypothetical protein